MVSSLSCLSALPMFIRKLHKGDTGILLVSVCEFKEETRFRRFKCEKGMHFSTKKRLRWEKIVTAHNFSQSQFVQKKKKKIQCAACIALHHTAAGANFKYI